VFNGVWSGGQFYMGKVSKGRAKLSKKYPRASYIVFSPMT
jgi:hypothetical protein